MNATHSKNEIALILSMMNYNFELLIYLMFSTLCINFSKLKSITIST